MNSSSCRQSDLVAVSIKTHGRPESLRACIASVEAYLGSPYRLYITDDSPPGETDEALLAKLESKGHFIRRYPQITPVTIARNEHVENTQGEAFLLRMDDDFELSPEFNLPAMLSILGEHTYLGALSSIERQAIAGRGTVSQGISPHQGYLICRERVLHKLSVPLDAWQWLGRSFQPRLSIADHTRNCLLLRMSVFSDVRWNEGLYFHGEHEAFMLDLKKAGWLLAFTPDSIHLHNESRSSYPGYSLVKQREASRKAMANVFEQEYGIERIELTYPAGKYLESMDEHRGTP